MTPVDEQQPLLERMATALEAMRPSERKVAGAVLADPAAALGLGMAAMADAAGVSEPTVMRFCTGLGFSGFQTFKYALAQTLALGMPVTHSAIRPDDTVESMVGKIFDHTLTTLDRARRSLDSDRVREAVDLLLAADDLLFVGHGASGIIAQDAVQHGVLFGIPCAAPTDLHQQFMAASTAGPGTVLVAVSNTGRTTSVLEVTERARLSGASVIAVVGRAEPAARPGRRRARRADLRGHRHLHPHGEPTRRARARRRPGHRRRGGSRTRAPGPDPPDEGGAVHLPGQRLSTSGRTPPARRPQHDTLSTRAVNHWQRGAPDAGRLVRGTTRLRGDRAS